MIIRKEERTPMETENKDERTKAHIKILNMQKKEAIRGKREEETRRHNK